MAAPERTEHVEHVDRPARTLAVFAAGLLVVFGAAYGVGRGFPDRGPSEPSTPMEHDGHPMETTP